MAEYRVRRYERAHHDDLFVFNDDDGYVRPVLLSYVTTRNASS